MTVYRQGTSANSEIAYKIDDDTSTSVVSGNRLLKFSGSIRYMIEQLCKLCRAMVLRGKKLEPLIFVFVVE